MSETTDHKPEEKHSRFIEHVRSGRDYFKKGLPQKALVEYRSALKLFPGDLGIRNRIAAISGEAAVRCGVEAVQLAASKALALSAFVEASARAKTETGEVADFPAFNTLNEQEFAGLVDKFMVCDAEAGDHIITEGVSGDSMYILIAGDVNVVREKGKDGPRVVDKMGPGAVFGEIALLGDTKRVASIVAETDCILLEIARSDYGDLTAEHPRLGRMIEMFYKERLTKNVFRSSEIFADFSADEVEKIIDAFEIKTFDPGAELLAQGQDSTGFYLILRGAVEVFGTDAEGRRSDYPPLTEGDFFGEISLLLKKKVTAFVRTTADSILLYMSPENFHKLISGHDKVIEQIADAGGERLERTKKIFGKIV